MEDFRASDLKRTAWGATARLAVVRGFASGVVWGVVFLFVPSLVDGNLQIIPLFPIILAVMGLPIALLIHGAGRLLSMIFPLAGSLYSMVGALVVCLGDPLVYIVNRMFPGFLNLTGFSIFNPRPLIMMTYDY